MNVITMNSCRNLICSLRLPKTLSYGYLISCLLALIILPIGSYPQESEDWYAKGKQALEGETGIGGAKGWLEFAKQTLSENLTAEILGDVLGQGELSLNEFLGKLPPAKIKEEIINDLRKIYFQEVNNQLEIAIDSFNKEIRKPDPEHKVDAYLKLVDAYLAMNREQEAVNTYEECQELGFGSVTLSTDEFKDILHRVAEVYWKGDVKSKKRYEDVEAELNKYLVAKDEIIAPASEINQGTDTHFTCSFIPKFEEKIINAKQPLLTEAIIRLIPTGKELSSKEISKHCTVIVYLPNEGKSTSVKLSNEIILNKDKNELRRVIPAGDYKVVIKIPELSIKDENRIPFRMKLSWPGGADEYIVITPSAQRNTKLILNELTSEGQESQKSQPIEIFCDKDTFTEHNILKDRQISIGKYYVTIQSFIHLLPGQAYNLSFEPAPPMPSPTPWWITATAIASGISILTYILQR